MLPKGLDYCEDVITLIQLWQNPIKITYVNKAFYYYDQHINEDSITRSYTKETYTMRCFYLDYLKKYLSDELYNKVYVTQFSLIAQESFFEIFNGCRDYINMVPERISLATSQC